MVRVNGPGEYAQSAPPVRGFLVFGLSLESSLILKNFFQAVPLRHDPKNPGQPLQSLTFPCLTGRDSGTTCPRSCIR